MVAGIQTILFFLLAAVCEIGGAYLIWLWRRDGKPLWWAAVGVVVLFLYGFIQTAQKFSFGRAFAAYGGLFITTAVLWGWWVDKHPPDGWDWAGVVVCLIGAGIIIWGPRG